MSQYAIEELPVLNNTPFDTFVDWYNNKRNFEADVVSDSAYSDMNLRKREQAEELQAQQLNRLVAANMLVDSNYRDGSVMMEGPFDHHRNASPSEYFMPFHISPYKLAMLARFTALGWRICYEFAQDCWHSGLGVKLIGEGMESKNREVNIKLKKVFRDLTFFEKMELATGFAREQGHSLVVLYYEGEMASEIGTESTKKKGIGDMVTAYKYLSEPAPEGRKVAKMEVFNRQYYFISKDDGRGNPLEFKVSIYLGKYSGRPQIPIHHSRCVWIRRTDVERDFEAHAVVEPCFNELVITTNILKACGEIAFRWGTGHPVIFTKGLSPEQAEAFKRLLGNPIRKDYHVFPEEMVAGFDLISQKSGMVDLPALGDHVIGLVVASTGIPRPILMGEVSGVVTGGEVNERSYFALLDKEHSTLEPAVVELFGKIPQIQLLIWRYNFEFDWGIRQTMSEMEQMDIETKKIANIISKISTFLPLNQGLNELGYPPLETMVDPEYRDYARMLGNSVLSFTIFQLREMEMGFVQAQQQLEMKNFQSKTISGNQSKGKGEGIKKEYGKGDPVKAPMNYQRSTAQSASMVKNKVGVLMSAFRNLPEFESVPKQSKALGISPTTFYKLEGWKDE